jgi:hypothetical protein
MFDGTFANTHLTLRFLISLRRDVRNDFFVPLEMKSVYICSQIPPALEHVYLMSPVPGIAALNLFQQGLSGNKEYHSTGVRSHAMTTSMSNSLHYGQSCIPRAQELPLRHSGD